MNTTDIYAFWKIAKMYQIYLNQNSEENWGDVQIQLAFSNKRIEQLSTILTVI